MKIEGGGTGVPEVPWPSIITDENRATILRNLGKDRSLAASVALAIIEEVSVLVKEDFDTWMQLPLKTKAQPDILFGHHYRDWDAYKRAAHAVLNAESIMETGKPFEQPGTDFQAIEREMRGSFRDFLLDEKEREEIGGQRKTAGEIAWFSRELTFAELYQATPSPLDFVDEVIKQEAERMHQRDRAENETMRHMVEGVEQIIGEKDEISIDSQDTSRQEEVTEFIEGITNYETRIKIDAMERGRNRFHQLYQEFNH